MSDPDPTYLDDLATFANVLGAIVEKAPDRPLTDDERAILEAVYAATLELHGSILVMLSDGDDAVTVRLALGEQPEAQA